MNFNSSLKNFNIENDNRIVSNEISPNNSSNPSNKQFLTTPSVELINKLKKVFGKYKLYNDENLEAENWIANVSH